MKFVLTHNKSISSPRFSFDCFSNTSHSDSSNMTTSSNGTSRKSVSRCHSDTSTISSKTEQQQRDAVNRSAECVNVNSSRQQQQLLKLSFFNSPNSPINQHNFNDPAMAERISQEARKISRQFAVSTDSSFEDLNNVSQSLIDNSTDSINDDFRDMKVDLKDIKVEPGTTSEEDALISNKIAIFQKQLKRIKQEQVSIDVDTYEPVQVKVEEPSPIKIPDTPSPPSSKQPKVKKEKLEMEGMLNNLKSLVAAGKNEEAKRQLGKLSEMLASQQEPKTIQVQPMVREGTFEIDKKTGKRIYVNGPRPQQPKSTNNKSNTDNILEKLQSMINTDSSLEVHNVQLMDSISASPIVVLVQKDMSTPLKYPRVPAMVSQHRPTSVVRALEGKKVTAATPQRTSNSAQPSTMPRNSLTTPRPSAVGQGKLHPYDQRLSQQKAGNVRKSLMTTMDKSPKDKSMSKTATKSASSAPARPASVRRSVSMKASVQINTSSVAASKPTSTVRPTTVSAKKIAEAVNLGRPSAATTPFKPSSAIKARSASTRIGDGSGKATFVRPKKPTFDHGSLV